MRIILQNKKVSKMSGEKIKMDKFIGEKITSGAEADIFLLNDDVYDIEGYDQNKQYIIKMFKERRGNNKIIDEFEIQNIAAKASMAPKAVHYSDEYITMEFVEGKLLQDIIDEDEEEEEEEEEDEKEDENKFYGEYVDDKIIDSIVIKGIDKLHKLKILHGDLSPMNIIIDPNGKIYFIDFSFSKYDKNFTKKYLDDNDIFMQIV
jgi:tRNA A-37 threonylcarbamoyl transferase component Bud32